MRWTSKRLRRVCHQWRIGRDPALERPRIIARRLSVMDVAIISVGTMRALEAAGIEYAIGDCLVAAAVATLLIALSPSA